MKYLISVSLFALVVSACATDGRTLAEPSGGQTTTTRPVTTSALSEEVSSSGFELVSPDFSPAGESPAFVTCQGGSKLPKLVWNNVPAETQEFAVTLADYTDFEEPVLLWLAGNIPANTTELDMSNPPTELVETQNDFGSIGFGTPCVEELGDGEDNQARDLQFRIYALTASAELEQAGHGNESWTEVRAKAFDSAAILMRYFPTSAIEASTETGQKPPTVSPITGDTDLE